MPSIKKIDEKDFVFVNKTLSAKEEKEFSDFLKARKAKSKQKSLRLKVIKKQTA